MNPTLDTPSILIALASIVIISYLFNLLAKKTRVPSVLMLLALGILLGLLGKFAGIPQPDVRPALEVLGSVGLIMIVLEAALDLELQRKQAGMVGRSMALTFLEMGGTTLFLGFLFHFFMDATWNQAILYAVPLSILSSAIIIPSVENMRHEMKEFMIYQSAFSDILGIMIFYFLAEGFDKEYSSSADWAIGFGKTFGLSVLVSAIFSYLLVLLLQKIRTQLKLFLLIAVLILLYAIGKMMHLSSLLVILIFGLTLNNQKLFFPGPLRFLLNKEILTGLMGDFKLITRETAFIVRTFFFVVFGYSIDLSSLTSISVILYSAVALVGIYVIRTLSVKFTMNEPKAILTYLAPRGLITILLFYAIPGDMNIPKFDNGILLYIILFSSVYMAWGMVRVNEDQPQRPIRESIGSIIAFIGSFFPSKSSEPAWEDAEPEADPNSSETPATFSDHHPNDGHTDNPNRMHNPN